MAPDAGVSRSWLERLAALEAELAAVPTPFLLVDLPSLDRNIVKLQSAISGVRHLSLWPHMKTHKSSWIARRQLDAGAAGITCATPEEARALTFGRSANVLLANVIADRSRLRLLATVAAEANVTAVADSSETVRLLADAAREAQATIGVLIELDIGMGRNGARSIAAATEVAQQAAEIPWLELRGVQAYEGHLVEIPDPDSRTRAVLKAFEPAHELLEGLRGAGLLEVGIVGGGSTATYRASVEGRGATAIQAGTYALMDATYQSLAPEFEIAAALVATVSTVSSDGTIVVDAGSKRMSLDWGRPRLLDLSSEYRGSSEEHSMFQILERTLTVGDRVALALGHVCTTFGLFARFVALDSNGSVDVIAIDGRDEHATRNP